jgi:hypothetical protein
MDESELVGRARAGDATAIEDVIARTRPLVWQWAYGVVGDRTLADHVAQEAVLRAFQSLDRFDPERPFRPWQPLTVLYGGASGHIRVQRCHGGAGVVTSLCGGLPRRPHGDADPRAVVKTKPARITLCTC